MARNRFAPSNDLALLHGASRALTRPSRRLAAEVERLRGELLVEAPWVAELDAGLVQRYLRASAAAHAASVFIIAADDLGEVSDHALQLASTYSTTADRLGDRLGLSLSARVKLRDDPAWRRRLACVEEADHRALAAIARVDIHDNWH